MGGPSRLFVTSCLAQLACAAAFFVDADPARKKGPLMAGPSFRKLSR
jgi:hypothetical protein